LRAPGNCGFHDLAAGRGDAPEGVENAGTHQTESLKPKKGNMIGTEEGICSLMGKPESNSISQELRQRDVGGGPFET
jgi:hypothetical protein